MRFNKKQLSEVLLVSIMSIFILGLSISPTIYNRMKAPKETQYNYAFNFFPDFFHYISFMRQGTEGDIGIVTRYTEEYFPKKIILPYIIYPLLGMIAGKMYLDLFVVYTVARVVLGGLRLLSIYLLIFCIVKSQKRRLFTFFLTIFLPSFTRIDFINNSPHFSQGLNGITNFDVFRRTVFIPHHLTAGIFNILFFIFFMRGIERKSLKNIFISGLFLLLAVVQNPALLICVAVITILFFMIGFISKKIKANQILQYGIIIFISVIPAILYYKLYMFTTYPWDNFSSDPKGAGRFLDLKNTLWTPIDYILALGPGAVFSTLFIIYKRKFEKLWHLLLFSWFTAPWILFVLCYFFYNKFELIFRLFQSQQFIPTGILASLFILEFLKKDRRRIVAILLVIILIIMSIPGYLYSFSTDYKEVDSSMYNIYLPSETLEAFEYLDQNSAKESVVLGGYFMNQIIPSYTHNRVYVGQSDLTYDYDYKLGEFTSIFSNRKSNQELKMFFNNHKIKYILFGPDTSKPEESFVANLDFVSKVFEKGNSYIYQVNSN